MGRWVDIRWRELPPRIPPSKSTQIYGSNLRDWTDTFKLGVGSGRSLGTDMSNPTTRWSGTWFPQGRLSHQTTRNAFSSFCGQDERYPSGIPWKSSLNTQRFKVPLVFEPVHNSNIPRVNCLNNYLNIFYLSSLSPHSPCSTSMVLVHLPNAIIGPYYHNDQIFIW